MQLVISIILTTIGILLIVFAIKRFFNSKTGKDIALFPMMVGEHTVDFKSPGLYSVCIFVAGNISFPKPFNIKVVPKTDSKSNLALDRNIIYSKIKRHGLKGAEYAQFPIEKTGSYTIQIENPETLILKSSPLFFKRLLEGGIGNKEDAEVLIMEAIPNYKRFLSLVFMILGAIFLVIGGGGFF